MFSISSTNRGKCLTRDEEYRLHLNLIHSHACSLCSWSDHKSVSYFFLWHLISLEVTFALSFLLCLRLNRPFHMCPLAILQWHFFWFLFEDGQMRGSLPCTMIRLLVMIFETSSSSDDSWHLFDMLLLSSEPHAGFTVNVSKRDAGVDVDAVLDLNSS